MKKILLLLFAVAVISSNTLAADIYKTVGDQLIRKDDIFNGRFPIYTEDGKWIFSQKPNWFSGFVAGELWYMYDITGNEEFKKRALIHSDSLIQYSTLDNTHDLGFIFFNSCVLSYKHTGEKKYRDAAIQAAKMLLKRYNPNGHFIRAWGKLGTSDNEGLMIIDTMMNLELLFWASQETGDIRFYDAAYKHAITCMNENVRKNYSSYHVIEFDPATGVILKRRTHQGYSDESTWARGQAWGIYGFALAYKFTGDERFLNTSVKMADYFLNNLPGDLVPRWDLDLKADTVKRDASAGAIAASGMYLISELTGLKSEYEKYLKYAQLITTSLEKNYLFTNSSRKTEEGILLHTIYNHAKGWGIDESFPAGDFYFIECLKKEYDQNNKKDFIENTDTNCISRQKHGRK